MQLPILSKLKDGEKFDFYTLVKNIEQTNEFWDWWWTERAKQNAINRPEVISDDDPILTDTSTKQTVNLSSHRDLFDRTLFTMTETGTLPVKDGMSRDLFHGVLRFLVANSSIRIDGKPQLVFTGGGYGSGKTTVINYLCDNGAMPVEMKNLVGPDVFKQLIPEYNLIKAVGDGRASITVQRECDQLTRELFLKHRRKKTVVRLLNEAGYRTRKGAKFTSKTVTRLLQDPTAKGTHRVNYTTRNGHNRAAMKPESEWIMHPVDAIVGSEIWEQCNQIIDDCYTKQKRPGKKPVHIFAGVAYCGCGQKMYVPSNSPKYVCRGCRNKIAIVDLDEIFCEQIKGFSLSTEAIANYLRDANETVREKDRLLETQQGELKNVQQEIKRTYDLYQQQRLDADGFSTFYTPLLERKKQLEASLPRLQAELDVMKVKNTSAEEIATQASNLHARWQKMTGEEKRETVEIITERITVTKDEITVALYETASSKDMANGWRKGMFLLPFCRLLIKTVRPDSPPFASGEAPFRKSLLIKRLALGLTQEAMAQLMGVSYCTLKNWETGRTLPSRLGWAKYYHQLES